MIFKCVNVLQLKLLFAKSLHAFHHFDKPTTRFLPFVSEKKRLFPFLKYRGLRFRLTIANYKNLSGLRDPVEQYM